MKVVNRIISVFLLGAAIFTFNSCAQNVTVKTEAKITEIKFAGNAATAVIDESSKKITVKYKEGTDLSTLKATIKLSDGASLVTKAADLDFTVSPVNIRVATEDETVTYVAEIRKVGSVIGKNNILFTEYYNGSTYSYKGANNQFLEISNVSETEEFDLSEVYLNRHVWLDGVRREDLDQSVPLTGIVLEPEKSLVMYNQRCSLLSGKTNAIYKSDADYNGIISFSGQDGYTLTYNGNVIDALGPNNGEGSGLTWGNSKQMQRKNKEYNKAYKEFDWLTTETEDSQKDFDNTVGKYEYTTNSSAYKNKTGKTLTYFNFEKSSDYFKTYINESDCTVRVEFYTTGYSRIQYPAVSCDGNGVSILVNGKIAHAKVESGVTELDLSKNNIVIRVTGDGGVRQDYPVTVETVIYNMSSDVNGTYAKVAASDIKDGDIILMACPAQASFIGSNPSGAALTAVDADLNDEIAYFGSLAAFCVSIKDGYYFFTCKGKFLTSKANSSLSFEGAPTDNSSWKFTTTNGTTLIKNKSNRAIEYYKSAYGSYTGSGDDYNFIFYKKL